MSEETDLDRLEELDFDDARLKLLKAFFGVDPDIKELYSVETYKVKRRVYQTEIDPETGEEKRVILEEPVRVKEFFDDFRKGFLSTSEYKWAINTLNRANQIKLFLSNLKDADSFIPDFHIKQVLTTITLSGSRGGIAPKTFFTRFFGKFEDNSKGGLFK